MKRITHKEYVKWVKENRSDYEVVERYVNTSTKILHRHIESGKEWMCTPDKFKSGTSHPEVVLGRPTKRTHKDYVKWVKDNRPVYEVTETYINVKTKISHKHKESGVEWRCSPEKFMQGVSPTELTNCERWDETKYKKYLTDNNIPVRLIGKFIKQATPTLHECLVSGEQFTLYPKGIIKNKNFQFNKVIQNTEDYNKWLSNNYPEIIAIDPYVNSHTKIKHVHIETGKLWNVRPNNVISGQRHPVEKPSSYSRRSIKWLDDTAKKQNIKIQHKLNGGEYTIDGIGKVDGFCKETNTVYEYHGDFWHGNPLVFKPDDINPVSKQSFGKLYENTIKREQQIKQLGYKLVSKWETEK